MDHDAAAAAPAVPFVYGSVAFWLGKKSAAGSTDHTHRWMVYVRHTDDKDLSFAVSRVAFTLHPSFTNHVRELTEAPYYVAETGWGEFEIGITIFLRDATAEPIQLVHRLKLYPSVGAMEAGKPVVDEHYDEIVFNALPRDGAVAAELRSGPQRDAPPYPYQEYFGSFDPAEDVARIQAARQYMQDRKVELQDRLLRAQLEAEREREEVKLLGAI